MKRLTPAEVRILIVQINVSDVPQAHEALMVAFEQILTCRFKTPKDHDEMFAVLRNKIDELDPVTLDEKMLAIAHVIAAKINQFGVNKLEHHTASGCEYIIKHFIQLMTINAPGLDITDLEGMQLALNAHIFSPSNKHWRSPTDALGKIHGFARGNHIVAI